jgi:hypothetical protein
MVLLVRVPDVRVEWFRLAGFGEMTLAVLRSP